jgi:hypothetical protein
MPHRVLRHLDEAPRDGTYILIKVREARQPVKAYWSTPLQGWVDLKGSLLRYCLAWAPLTAASQNDR